MNILVLSYWDVQDKGMQVIGRTLEYFAGQGHEVSFLVNPEYTAEPSSREDICDGVKVYRFRLPMRFLARWHYPGRARSFLFFFIYSLLHVMGRWGKGYKYDVVYAAECDAVLTGSFLSRLMRVPLVTRFYGVARLSRKFDFERGVLSSDGVHDYLSIAAFKKPCDLAVITDDGSRGREIFSALNPGSRNVLFLRNGVDEWLGGGEEAEAIRKRYGICESDLALMTLCRLDTMKRVDRAIKAMRHVNASAKDVHLLIVGHGELEQELKRLAADEGLADVVHFVGGVSHESTRDYYQAADIFLSLYDITNVGNPLLEALSAGKCIITLNNGATSDIIKDGVNGSILSADMPEEELIKAISGEIMAYHDDRNRLHAVEKGARDTAAKLLRTWDSRLAEELDAIGAIVK